MTVDIMRRLGCVAVLVPMLVVWSAPARASEDGTTIVADAPIDPLELESAEDLDGAEAGFPDPWEGMNRRTLRFNQQLDRWLLNPITRVYGFVVPMPARRAVRRILENLNCPSVMVNDLLQREWRDAGVTVARFALNSTVGLAGLLDPATGLGLEGHESDFGQTLALAGVKSGPFIVLPALGPITARDGVGLIVDAMFRPTTYVLGPGAEMLYQGGSGFVVREANFDALQALEASSVDYYAALRNAYYQDRIAEIWTRRAHHRLGLADTGGVRTVHRAWRSRPGPITR